MSTEAPWPVMEVAIEPKSKADQEKLAVALQRLVAEDPTFRVAIDQESGQTLLQGMEELHLDSKVDLLKRTYKVDANVGHLQVVYRETLGRAARVRHTHKRLTDGAGEFADLTIEFVPAKAGEGYSFESRIAGTLPEEYVAGIERGLDSGRQKGLLVGFPVIDFKAILIDAAYHELDSTASAFEIAAREAFRELRGRAHPGLLEPMMRVEVTTPEDLVGDVIGDLNSRKGHIEGTDQRGDAQVIVATAPLSNMFGYVNVLRYMSQGRASFHMEFDHYAAVPRAFDPDPDLFPPAAAMRA